MGKVGSGIACSDNRAESEADIAGVDEDADKIRVADDSFCSKMLPVGLWICVLAKTDSFGKSNISATIFNTYLKEQIESLVSGKCRKVGYFRQDRDHAQSVLSRKPTWTSK